jgi:hypothetical protein
MVDPFDVGRQCFVDNIDYIGYAPVTLVDDNHEPVFVAYQCLFKGWTIVYGSYGKPR